MISGLVYKGHTRYSCLDPFSDVCTCEYSSRFMCLEHTGTLLPLTFVVITV